MVSFGLKPMNDKFFRHAREVNAKFDANYPKDFVDTTPGVNRFGGKNTTAIQVLSDRCGYYIGKLLYDQGLNKFIVDEFYGNHHYKTRAEAEAILNRYKSIYKL